MNAPQLTTRERAALNGFAYGFTPAELAKQLYTTEVTVKHWARTLYRKLDTHDRAHTVAKAYRLGLLIVPGCTCRGGVDA